MVGKKMTNCKVKVAELYLDHVCQATPDEHQAAMANDSNIAALQDRPNVIGPWE